MAESDADKGEVGEAPGVEVGEDQLQQLHGEVGQGHRGRGRGAGRQLQAGHRGRGPHAEAVDVLAVDDSCAGVAAGEGAAHGEAAAVAGEGTPRLRPVVEAAVDVAVDIPDVTK